MDPLGESLDLSGKGLRRLDVFKEIHPKVLSLKADNNHVNTLSGIIIFPCLMQLSCRANRISDLYPLSQLQQLVIINVQNNAITTIQGLDSLHNMQWLSLAGNTIKDASGIVDCISLTHLDLSDNFIKILPDLSRLKVLKTLLLHGNGINYLQSSNTSLLPNSLHTLTLAENSITDLNEFSSINSIKFLKQFSLMGNPCTTETTNDGRLIDYRSFILYWCPSVTVLDGVSTTDIERHQSRMLFFGYNKCPFTISQHTELIQYISKKASHMASTDMSLKPPSQSLSLPNNENTSPNTSPSRGPIILISPQDPGNSISTSSRPLPLTPRRSPKHATKGKEPQSPEIMETLKTLKHVQRMIRDQEQLILDQSMVTNEGNDEGNKSNDEGDKDMREDITVKDMESSQNQLYDPVINTSLSPSIPRSIKGFRPSLTSEKGSRRMSWDRKPTHVYSPVLNTKDTVSSVYSPVVNSSTKDTVTSMATSLSQAYGLPDPSPSDLEQSTDNKALLNSLINANVISSTKNATWLQYTTQSHPKQLGVQPRQIASTQFQPRQLASTQFQPQQLASTQFQPQQLASTQFQPQQLASAQFQPRQIDSSQFQSQQLASAQFQPRQLASIPFQPQQLVSAQFQPRQIDSAQFQPRQIDSAQFQPQQLASAQFQPRQIDSTQFQPQQLASAQFQPRQIDSTQFQPQQLPSTQFQPQQLASTQFQPRQIDSAQFQPQQLDSAQFQPKQLASTQFQPRQLDSTLFQQLDSTQFQPKQLNSASRQLDSVKVQLNQLDSASQQLGSTQFQLDSANVQPRQIASAQFQSYKLDTVLFQPDTAQLQPNNATLFQIDSKSDTCISQSDIINTSEYLTNEEPFDVQRSSDSVCSQNDTNMNISKITSTESNEEDHTHIQSHQEVIVNHLSSDCEDTEHDEYSNQVLGMAPYSTNTNMVTTLPIRVNPSAMERDKRDDESNDHQLLLTDNHTSYIGEEYSKEHKECRPLLQDTKVLDRSSRERRRVVGLLEYRQAAIVIQSLWRGFVCRKKKLLKKHKAAILIQATWRGYYCRVYNQYVGYVYREMNRRKAESYITLLYLQLTGCREELAHQIGTVQIQEEALKSLLTEVEEMRCDQIKQDRLKRIRAAIVIQKYWRGYHTRKTVAIPHRHKLNPDAMCTLLKTQVVQLQDSVTNLANLLVRQLDLPSPCNLRLSHFSSSCLLIHWDSPPDTPLCLNPLINCPNIDKYRIYINGELEGKVSPLKTKAYIEGLDSSVSYNITVTALYESGKESLPSNPVVAILSSLLQEESNSNTPTEGSTILRRAITFAEVPKRTLLSEQRKLFDKRGSLDQELPQSPPPVLIQLPCLSTVTTKEETFISKSSPVHNLSSDAETNQSTDNCNTTYSIHGNSGQSDCILQDTHSDNDRTHSSNGDIVDDSTRNENEDKNEDKNEDEDTGLDHIVDNKNEVTSTNDEAFEKMSVDMKEQTVETNMNEENGNITNNTHLTDQPQSSITPPILMPTTVIRKPTKFFQDPTLDYYTSEVPPIISGIISGYKSLSILEEGQLPSLISPYTHQPLDSAPATDNVTLTTTNSVVMDTTTNVVIKSSDASAVKTTDSHFPMSSSVVKCSSLPSLTNLESSSSGRLQLSTKYSSDHLYKASFYNSSDYHERISDL